MTDFERDQLKKLILRRRCQLLVHSVIYYKMNDNLIPDTQWSTWAVELENLQIQHPDISSEVDFLYDAFKDFDHSTGSNLPLDDSWAVGTAIYLLKIARKR